MGKCKISVMLGDITKIKCDAVVNAANNSLLGGGGVDGAIHKAGGKGVLDECILIREKQGGCRTGEAVITTAGNLPAQKIIHTVGPVWNGGKTGEEELLKSCYRNVLKIAVENSLKRIAIPNISTGIYGYPKERAAETAIKEVKRILENSSEIEVIFVCYERDNYEIYMKKLQEK